MPVNCPNSRGVGLTYVDKPVLKPQHVQLKKAPISILLLKYLLYGRFITSSYT